MAITSSFKKHAKTFIYRREIFLILSTAFTLFLLLSLLSYNANDSSLFFYSTAHTVIKNWCGFVGATCAALLFHLLGGAAYIGIAIFFFTIHVVARNRMQQEWDRIVASCMFMLIIAALSSFYLVDMQHVSYPGGLLGLVLQAFLQRWLDKLGAVLFLGTLFSITFIVITRFSWVQYISKRKEIRFTYMRYAYAKIYILMRYALWPFIILTRFFIDVWLSLFGSRQKPFMPLPYEYDTDLMQQHNDQAWKTVLMPAHKKQKKNDDIIAHKDTLVETKHDSPLPIRSDVFTTHYCLPPLSLFSYDKEEHKETHSMAEFEQRAKILEEKLERFGIEGKVVAIKRGPVVTLFEYKPAIDAKISKIVALEDDLALALQALSIRIIAPIPGTSVVGFEVANAQRKKVALAEVIQSSAYTHFTGQLPLILGKNTIGNHVVVDLVAMPHLLVAGSTGSGKSVALNAMLVSLLCKCTPEELKLILIDPKRLEFSAYADIAHLLFPIVTNPKQAAPILQWVVKEMEARYAVMAERGARNMQDFNAMVEQAERKPHIVVIIDELADLMMTASKDIETLIARIAQMARAAGIHMIVATQRPSVDVITGLIKVNLPSRISFRVISKVDSRTILDCAGADKLLGKGDMLFLDASDSLLKRIHGAYVSDKEIALLMQHIRSQRESEYLDLLQELPREGASSHELNDPLYDEVLRYIQEIDELSISLLQRKFRIGYNRSARIIETLESRGLVMPSDGKTRKVVRN